MYLLYSRKKMTWINEDLRITSLRAINPCLLCKLLSLTRLLDLPVKRGKVDSDVNIRHFPLGTLVSPPQLKPYIEVERIYS